MYVITLLLHEIFPSGPWVFVAFIGLGVLFVTPLYVIRRKYGGRVLVLATTVEVIVGAANLRDVIDRRLKLAAREDYGMNSSSARRSLGAIR